MVRRISAYLSFFLVLALLSCEVKMPDDIIAPDKMEKLLYDYHLVQSMSSEYASDEYKEKLYFKYVFAKHNVTEAEFDSSLVWYNRYPKHMFRIYQNLEQRLEGEVEMMSNTKGVLDEGVSLDVAYLASDTAELWTSTPSKMLLSTPLQSTLTFDFETSDTLFVAGDSLSFSFDASFVSGGIKDIRQGTFAAITVAYEDGKVEHSSVRVEKTGHAVLTLNRYFDSRPVSMNGFVYYSDNDTTASARLVLTGISVIRIHPPVDEGDADGRGGALGSARSK